MSGASNTIDAARVELLLSELRLPGVKAIWPKLAAQSDKEGWPAARFLAALAEHENADRGRRRIERHMAEARLPAGKTLATFDFESVPMVSKAQVTALAAGDVWLKTGANVLLFGPPGGWKSHLSAALGLALVENGWRVLFARTTDLVQRLQVARRELALESALAKLDRYDLLILDDIAYVTKDQAETSVLFELIAARYERRSMLITANQPFGEWGKIFPDQAMTLAAVDRLVHHATILEMNVESYRRKAALLIGSGRGRPPAHTTPKEIEKTADRRKRCTVIVAQRQSELAKASASDNHPLARPPLLILIDAPLSSRLSRYIIESYALKYEKAADCLDKDRDALLAFYDFPAEHWKHLRTTNPIESTFATVRHRTIRSKGCLSNKTALAMVFKLVEGAQKSWRRLDGHSQLPKLILGVKFSDGLEVTAKSTRQPATAAA